MRKLTAFLLLLLSSAASAAVTGRVVDEDGKPLAAATIRVYAAETTRASHARLVSAHPERDPLVTATTNDDGAFSVETKGSAAVNIVFSAAGKALRGLALSDNLDLGPVLMRDAAPHVVKVTAGGKPVANALVAFTPDILTRTDSAGTFDSGGQSSATIIHPDYMIEQFPIARNDEAKLQKGIAVRGRVMNANGPAAHATLTINGYPLAESGDDGAFTIAHAPAGWRSIQAFAGTDAGVAVRGGTAAVEIHMRRAPVLGGVVRDAVSGDPVAGAGVTVTMLDEREAIVASTDAKGRFTFDPLPPGRYAIFGEHWSYTIDSTTLSLTESMSRTLSARPFATIRGRVSDESRQPVGGALISVPGQGGLRRTITDAGGNFLLRVPADSRLVRVTALKRGYAAGTSPRMTLKPAQVVDKLAITLPQGFPLQVRVINRGRKPVPGVRLGLSLRDEAGPGAPAACVEPSRDACTVTGADGSVAFRITEGDYALSARTEAAKIAPANREATFTARSSPYTLEIDAGVSLSGRVTYSDGTPVPGAEVHVNFGPGSTELQADAAGAFTFESLAPARVTVVASTVDRRISSAPVEVTPPAQNVVLTLPRGGRVQGRVVDRATQRPVTDFTVVPVRRNMMGPGASPQPVHAEDGAYAMDDVPPGLVTIGVTAAGYVGGSRSDVNVEEGATVTGIDVQLDRGARLTGRVTADGKPLSGVAIALPGAAAGPPPGRAVTDGDGAYALDGLSPGERIVEFHKQGFVTGRKSVELAVAKDTRLDMELDRGRELRGRVVDSGGAPVAGAAVDAQAGNFADNARGVSEADGTFVIDGLSEARYSVTARKTGLVSATAREIEVPPSTPLVLTLKSGATVTGRVTGLGERDLANVQVWAGGNGSSSSAQTDASGAFTLRGVPDGRVGVTAMLMSGERRSQPKMIDVENGTAPPVEINFDEGFTIRGKISFNGVPAAAGSINFVPTQGAPNRQLAFGRINNGLYEVNGLGSGEYRVTVSSSEGSYNAKYDVTGSTTYDIEIQGANVRGRVIDAASSAPVSGAQVGIFGKAQINRGASTDSDGRFVLTAVPDGTYTVNVVHAPHAPASKEVTVAGGVAPDVELKLEGGTPVVIRIVDAMTGSTLSMANASVVDAKGAYAGGGMQRDESGVRVYLQSGRYMVNVFAPGYLAQQKVELTVPTSDVRIPMQRGGRVVFQAKAPHRVRIVAPGAAKPLWMGNAGPGNAPSAENIAPGAYLLEILAADGSVEKSLPVTVLPGDAVTVILD